PIPNVMNFIILINFNPYAIIAQFAIKLLQYLCMKTNPKVRKVQRNE
ncbi:MAG: hypothetical protein ACI9O1_001081, partial [Candidatus Thalassarchaeaceae archaeon]